MTQTPKTTSVAKDKRAKLSEALRKNLRRRKTAAATKEAAQENTAHATNK